MLKKLLIAVSVVSVLALAGFACVFYWFVIVNPGEEIKTERIRSILGKESHVYYSDSVTPLGVFFDQAHRQYVEYSQIPQSFVNALVASEDNRFFSHYGFDPLGILRATLSNIKAGQVVQGGSTLTQQTAKNLFNREDRSLRSKLKELLFALRLEYHYPKEKIFEFYTNQFYVSGNGHGLGIAARYYFDKKPQDLSLVECAFIAGSVKRPNYYNPFIKKTEKESQLAIDRGMERLRYVLGKMLELGFVDQRGYQAALNEGLHFKQGKVGYSLDYVMDLVKEAVSSSEVLEALDKNGISNIATSGVRIITNIDKDLQAEALYSLRHELSQLDVTLRGYTRSEVQGEYEKNEFEGDSQLEPKAFLFGTIEKIVVDDKALNIVVDFGKKRGKGVIDLQGMELLAGAKVKSAKASQARVGIRDIASVLQQFHQGDRIWVSIREKRADGSMLLDLEKFPKVEGGAIVVKDGQIRAMAGGVENRFFNRAVSAQRTMGSSFKPFLYTAALQLGWNSADLLQNSRGAFVFRNQPYFPHPDHNSPFSSVSMSYAGIHSENLATIWLVDHLCDRLSPDQFKEVAENLGLAPRNVKGENEPYQSYVSRIRDNFGILVNRETLRAAAFRLALKNAEADFLFENLADDYAMLKSMPYGLGFDKLVEHSIDSTNMEMLDAEERNEFRLRQGLLSLNYLNLEKLYDAFQRFQKMSTGRQEDERGDAASAYSGADLFYDPITERYVFTWPGAAASHLERISAQERLQKLAFMNPQEEDAFWASVRLSGKVSVASIELLRRQIDNEFGKLSAKQAYSLDVLTEIEDFRKLTGLKYLVEMGKSMGIHSRLEPVLSMPLGSNVVTLLETTRMYETMVTGTLNQYGSTQGEYDGDALAVIDRIESESGEILYKPDKVAKKVVDEKTRIAIGHILENVINFGTGRQARSKVRLPAVGLEKGAKNLANLPLPLLGKTGTANNYTNASFFGYLPGFSDEKPVLTTANGYTVGAYVGYDDNAQMRNGSVRISGAAGALPIWIDIVNFLATSTDIARKLDPAEVAANGLTLARQDQGQMNLAADPGRGGALVHPGRIVRDMDHDVPSILTFAKQDGYGGLELSRFFAPFWRPLSEDKDSDSQVLRK